jgi:formylglycine-generating enzyme required for sulfatase activity
MTTTGKFRLDMVLVAFEPNETNLSIQVKSFAAIDESHAPWTKAIHTFPIPVWELTLATGAAIAKNERGLGWDELWAMLRLQCLRENRFSTSLRLELDTMSSDEAVIIGRRTIRDMLETALVNLGGQRGIAGTQIARELVHQRFRLEPTNPDYQADHEALIAMGLVPEEKNSETYRKRNRWIWLAFCLSLFITGLLGFQLVAFERTTEVNIGNRGGLLKLDSIRVDTAFIDVVEQTIYPFYERGKHYYESDNYLKAISDFQNGLQANDSISKLMPSDSKKYLFRENRVRARLMNGIGLSYFYKAISENSNLQNNSEMDSARSYYYQIVKFVPLFFYEISPKRPNLESLLNIRPAIFGVITTTYGQPIPDVQICYLQSGAITSITTSDSNGRYQVPEAIFFPNITILIRKSGFRQQQFEVGKQGERNLILNTFCDNSIKVNVHVEDQLGVEVLPSSVLPNPLITVSKIERGRISMQVCGKMNENIHFQIEADGYFMLDTISPLQSDIYLVMKRPLQSILSGNVRDEDGNAIENFDIDQFELENLVTIRKSPGGRFEIEWLNPDIQIPRNLSFRKIVLRALGFKPLECPNLISGTNRTFILERLIPHAETLTITLLDRNKNPISQAYVYSHGQLVGTLGNSDHGIVKISIADLDPRGGQLKITSQNFEKEVNYGPSFESITITLAPPTPPLDPQIQKSIDQFIFVKNVTFKMGSNIGEADQKPVHDVELNDFYMNKYEVTQKQWMAIMGYNPSIFKGCDNCPVDAVSWHEVQTFIARLNDRSTSGFKYRLPTEAEWEFVASNDKTDDSLNTNTYYLQKIAWYSINSGKGTHSVGGKAPNSTGCYDMMGNVYEWCQDWYAAPYPTGSSRNPIGPSKGEFRVIRGGAWNSKPKACGPSMRAWVSPMDHHSILGFRLARE